MVWTIAFSLSDSNTFPLPEHNHLRCSNSSRLQHCKSAKHACFQAVAFA